jgi:hypothetical protein
MVTGIFTPILPVSVKHMNRKGGKEKHWLVQRKQSEFAIIR